MVKTPGQTPAGAAIVPDLRAGFLVFLIALPLCLGIAMASSFPPIAGVLTAIVGGVLVTFVGSARLTIKGPAAGLIVIALGAVQELGQGDPMVGYRRALAVGAVAAVVQMVFALVGAATVGVAMSPSVVHGMLAAIGIIIMAKQTHTAMGVLPHSKGPLQLLAEIPESLMHANPAILLIGALSLVILFGMPLIKARWARMVPAPMVVLAMAVPLGWFLDLEHQHLYTFMGSQHQVGEQYLVQLPGTILAALAFPDFSMVTSMVSIKYIVMFALVGTIESTLSVIAVDSMDPEKRASNLNRDLLALGAGNLLSACIGGLPMISEIVRSRANIDAGAKSKLANFFHGSFLLLFVALAPGLLHRIPLAALAAMLIYTGARLASPHEFRHALKVGRDQFILFMTTLVVTLATDLLLGVAAGIALKVVLHLTRGATLGHLFGARVETHHSDEELRVSVHGAAAFTSLLKVRRHLADVGPHLKRVVVDLNNAVLVDHTFLQRLESMAQEWPQAQLVLTGLENMHALSDHPHAARRKVALP